VADDTTGAAPRTLLRRIDAWERLVRLDKPIGILLLLWPTLAALWIAARGAPPVTLVVIFTLGTVLMRSAGCAFNDWADMRYDAHVARTRGRPLVTGEVPPREALAVAGALAAIAFVLVLFTNRATLLLSLAALAIAVVYPFFKRFFALPQAFLGIAFSFGIPMAFAAIRGDVERIAWWMLAFNLLWVVAYDTEYAMVDRDDDVRIGMRTSAITFGRFDVLAVALCYAGYFAGMTWVGRRMDLGPIYFVGLLAGLGCAAYHLWLIRGRDRERCFKAFLHNHWLGLAVFAGTVADYAIRARAWPRSL
jgi:4-hydroxybenzoate polyprenyltransferase